MKKFLVVFVATLIFTTPVFSQGLPIKSGSTSDLATVNTNKALEVIDGESSRASYIASMTGGNTTAANPLLSLEAEAARGFRVRRVCVSGGAATAAAWTTWFLIRTTAASSGGTLIAAEVTTGANSLAKMDPADANWSGVARALGTGGTSGAILDSGAIFANIVGTPPTMEPEICRDYCLAGGKCPTVVAGTTNGVKIQFTGTAGGVSQAAKIYFIAD